MLHPRTHQTKRYLRPHRLPPSAATHELIIPPPTFVPTPPAFVPTPPSGVLQLEVVHDADGVVLGTYTPDHWIHVKGFFTPAPVDAPVPRRSSSRRAFVPFEAPIVPVQPEAVAVLPEAVAVLPEAVAVLPEAVAEVPTSAVPAFESQPEIALSIAPSTPVQKCKATPVVPLRHHVAEASQITADHGGVMPSWKELREMGKTALASAMQRHPDAFAHLEQKVLRKKKKSHKPTKRALLTRLLCTKAEEIAKEQGGYLLPPPLLIAEGNGDVAKALKNRPELFSHIPVAAVSADASGTQMIVSFTGGSDEQRVALRSRVGTEV